MGRLIDFKDAKVKDVIKKQLRGYDIDEVTIKKVDDLKLEDLNKGFVDSYNFVNKKTVDLEKKISKVFNTELKDYEVLIRGYLETMKVQNMIKMQEEEFPTKNGKITLDYLEEFKDNFKYLYAESELLVSILAEIRFDPNN